MGFNWNFKPKTINGFDSQPVDTLNPQVQPQPIQMSPVGLRGNETWRNQYNMPQTQRAAYMDEYEADQKWNEQPAELMQKADDGRISALENEIATLKQRIQENTAKLNNWTGNADQIAAIEARKINGADPTSIWRWKEDRDNARRIANAQNKANDTARANVLIEANNALDSMIINDSLDTPTKNAMLSKLADIKSNLEKNNFDPSRAQKMIDQLKGIGDQTSREKTKTDWKGLKGRPGLKSTDIREALTTGNWDPDEKLEAENMALALEKKEAAAQDFTNMKNWVKSTYGTEWASLSPRLKETYKRVWNKRKGKK